MKSVIFATLFALLFLIHGTEGVYKQVNAFINQTAIGYFRAYANGGNVFRVPSIWMQDDVSKKLRIDVGIRGQPGFQTEYYFIGESHYELTQGPDNTYVCTHGVGFGYYEEVSTYGPQNFGYVGRHVLVDRGNKVADIYAGQAQDAVGLINAVMHIGLKNEYLALLITGQVGQINYLEYWYGDDVSMTIPPSSYFDLPQECNTPAQTVYYGSKTKPMMTKKPWWLRSRFY